MEFKSLYIEIGKKCNLKCMTCDGHSENKELTTDMIQKVLFDAKKNGFRRVFITGGEPMVREDIFDIITYAHNCGLNVNMTTNGTLLSEAVIESLYEAGLTGIALSLDGTETINDSIRGIGVYHKVVKALEIFKKKKLSRMVSVIFTVSRQNYYNLPEMIKVVSKYGVRTILLNVYDPDFIKINKLEKFEKFWIPENEIKELRESLSESKQLTRAMGMNFPSDKYLDGVVKYFENNKNFIAAESCSVPEESCVVDVNGHVMGCWKLSCEHLIFDMRFSDILKSTEYKRIIERAHIIDCPHCLFACYSK